MEITDLNGLKESKKKKTKKRMKKREKKKDPEETSHQQMTGNVFVRPIQYAEQENVQYLDRKVK